MRHFGQFLLKAAGPRRPRGAGLGASSLGPVCGIRVCWRYRTYFRAGSGALLCLQLLVGPAVLLGQGINLMHTGSGGPLLSQSLSLTGTAGTNGASLVNLDVGFATDEKPQPGFIPDSFTISITGPDGTVYLVTLDAGGAHWTPTVPGALPVIAASLQWQSSPFLAAAGGLTNLASYVIAYTLPANWQGVALTVNFDLFDNQNSLPSLAYYSTVSVPEPSGPMLFLLALLFWQFSVRSTAYRRVRFESRRIKLVRTNKQK